MLAEAYQRTAELSGRKQQHHWLQGGLHRSFSTQQDSANMAAQAYFALKGGAREQCVHG